MEEDFYKILDVSRNSTADDIQKAYRKLARKYHPDINSEKNAKKKFQQIQQAYDVLNDPQKREMYDRYGSSFESAGAGPGPGGASRTSGSAPGGFEGFDFSQLFGGAGGGEASFEGPFGQFFQQASGRTGGSGRRAGARPRRGSDLRHELEIPFHTAVMGGEARLRVVRADTEKEETITAKIPAGVADGQTIRLRGQGEPGPPNGTPGDLLIAIRVAPHPVFRRNGLDLEVDVPVTVGEAGLGTKIDVPSPHGTITLKIPAAASSGKRLRIKGQGIHRKDGEKGDLYAVIQIVLPSRIDSASAELLKTFDQQQPFNPRVDLRW